MTAPADLEPRPEAATAVFGARLGLAEAFVEHLATSAVEWGLLGPREVPRLWTRHVLNCAVVAEVVPDRAAVVDVGSGAGLPGIALALARPDLSVTLVEPLERRVAWLQRVVVDLDLDVDVRRGRAEELADSLAAPIVTARAVAPLRQLAQWGIPLTTPGGTLLAIKGQTAREELARTAPALRQLGARSWEIVTCGTACLAVPTTVVRVRVGEAARPAARRARGGRRAGRKGPR